jgi:hypothetical protein
MFCPKCGANLPEGAPFCSSCGSQMEAQQTQQQFNQQPQFDQGFQQAPVYSSAKLRGLSKKQFLATEASESAKNMAKFSIVAFIVAAVLVITSVIVANNTPFYKLPAISAILSLESEDAIDEIEEELESNSEIFDEARDALEDFEDDLDDDEYKEIEKFIDAAENMAENPSLASITAAVNQVEKLTDLDIDSELESQLDFDSLDEVDEILGILNGMMTATYIFAAIVILLALLAYFKKSIALTVVAAVISSLPVCLFAGFIWYVLILAALIAMAVMFSKINKEYTAVK